MAFLGKAIAKIADAAKSQGAGAILKEAGKAGLKGRKLYKLGKKALGAGVKKTASRAAAATAFAASITKQAEAREAEAKARQSSSADALIRYNQLINMNSTPAEGTGEASSGGQTNGTSGGVYPVGN